MPYKILAIIGRTNAVEKSAQQTQVSTMLAPGQKMSTHLLMFQYQTASANAVRPKGTKRKKTPSSCTGNACNLMACSVLNCNTGTVRIDPRH